jgi:hypothetical protein
MHWTHHAVAAAAAGQMRSFAAKAPLSLSLSLSLSISLFLSLSFLSLSLSLSFSNNYSSQISKQASISLSPPCCQSGRSIIIITHTSTLTNWKFYNGWLRRKREKERKREREREQERKGKKRKGRKRVVSQPDSHRWGARGRRKRPRILVHGRLRLLIQWFPSAAGLMLYIGRRREKKCLQTWISSSTEQNRGKDAWKKEWD